MAESFEYMAGPDPEMMGSPDGPEPSRRGFLFWFGAAINGLIALLIAIPVVGYIISPWKQSGWQKWTSLGKADAFPKGQTRLATFTNPFTIPWDGETAGVPCWVRREDNGNFTVFAINCTHLGCPVRWFPESNLFMCPCHGGVYYSDGSHAAGPPPRGLYIYESRVTKDTLEINAGRLPTLQQSP